MPPREKKEKSRAIRRGSTVRVQPEGSSRISSALVDALLPMVVDRVNAQYREDILGIRKLPREG